MEMAIISIVLGMGVYFKNEQQVRDKYGKKINNYESKTNGRNIYNSYDTINVRKSEQEQMNKLYEQAKNTKETNVFIPGPPSGFINNDNNDYTDSKLPIEFNEDGLIPAVAQQHDTNEVLMMAWMSKESIAETLETGRVCFWSRSRQAFWRV